MPTREERITNEGADKKLDLKQNKFQEVQLYVLTRAKDKGGRSTHTI